MSDENPFQCKQPNCGRSFTKEEHLAQHLKKHELGLTTQHLNEPEQTPTPTRGLHLGDLTDTLQIPLTADLDAAIPSSPMREIVASAAAKTPSKAQQASNPFDRAFRAANFELRRSISNTSVDSNKTIPVINNLAPQGMLRTPQPSIGSINSETLGFATNLMQLGTGTGEISLTGLLPISPLPSTSNANAKPNNLSKTSTITSFLASLGFTGTDDAAEAAVSMATPSPTGEQPAKAAAGAVSKQEPSESYLSSINLQDQPQVLLLHTPQPQPSTPSDQGQMMFPLAMNAQGAIVHNAGAGGSAGAGISSAQLYVPYILQENGTMVPLGRLSTAGGLTTLDASGVTLQDGALQTSSARSSTSDNDARNSVDVDIDVDVVVEEEAVTSSSTLSSSASNARHRTSGRSAAEGAGSGLSSAAPDKKDKVKEAIRRRCATSAADSMSPAPPRKRLARGHEESGAIAATGAVSPTASATSATDDGDSNRSTSAGQAPGFLLRLGQPIRGRKAMELAAKLEMSTENDRKRDQLEKKLLYLERNRAASQRSRDKKKKIMSELRDKNRVIDSRNKQLEQANLRLREEVVYLKSLLLQHIDCPKLPFQLKAAEGFKNEAMASFLLNGGERPTQAGETATAATTAAAVAAAAAAAAASGESFVNVVALDSSSADVRRGEQS